MILNVFINSSSFTDNNIVSCSVSGIEVARADAIVNREVACGDGTKLVCVQTEITAGVYTDLDTIFNNYNNYAYIKTTGKLVAIANTMNVNREIAMSSYNGSFPQTCTNMALNVGGIGAGTQI